MLHSMTVGTIDGMCLLMLFPGTQGSHSHATNEWRGEKDSSPLTCCQSTLFGGAVQCGGEFPVPVILRCCAGLDLEGSVRKAPWCFLFHSWRALCQRRLIAAPSRSLVGALTRVIEVAVKRPPRRQRLSVDDRLLLHLWDSV
uniref:Secreted protein n=1 Tax=Physcomitrium patens TaxID=3218 RepID=A0A2K1IQE5_PHYPA|nr:hypothetical protein PHYPA_025621 [Physcomitrium patens]